MVKPESYFELKSDIPYQHKHIEAETKWTPYRRRHFQLHFLESNAWISLMISLKFVPKVRSDNGLAPARGQAIIWTNDG